MSVVAVCHPRELCGLLRVQIILCKVIFFQKELFGNLIVFRHLNIDFTLFLTVILSDLIILSLSFKTKT